MKTRMSFIFILVALTANAQAADWHCELWGQKNSAGVSEPQTLLGELDVDSSDYRSEKQIQIIQEKYMLTCKGMMSPQGDMFACGFSAPENAAGYSDAWVSDSSRVLHMHTKFEDLRLALYCWTR